MGGDEVLERDEAHGVPVGRGGPVLLGDPHEARQQRRNLQSREMLLLRPGVDQDDGEVEREARDVGERMRGVDRQWGEDREDVVGEVVAELVLLGRRELVPPDDGDALMVEGRTHLLVEDPGLDVEQLVADPGDVLQDLSGLEPGCRTGRDTGRDAALEAGHADHEELVQVGGEDREVAGPLEQRHVLVGRQLQHALVELQPGHFPVEEAVGRQFRVLLVGRGTGQPDEAAVRAPQRREGGRGPDRDAVGEGGVDVRRDRCGVGDRCGVDGAEPGQLLVRLLRRHGSIQSGGGSGSQCRETYIPSTRMLSKPSRR